MGRNEVCLLLRLSHLVRGCGLFFGECGSNRLLRLRRIRICARAEMAEGSRVFETESGF